jgi:hypothetical protein
MSPCSPLNMNTGDARGDLYFDLRSKVAMGGGDAIKCPPPSARAQSQLSPYASDFEHVLMEVGT